MSNCGLLVEVTGKVESLTNTNGEIFEITVQDSSNNPIRIFINDYIEYSNSNSLKIESFIKIGETIKAVGLASIDTNGNRIRVRDKSEITLISQSNSNTNNSNGTDNTNTGTDSNTKPTVKIKEQLISSNTEKIQIEYPLNKEFKCITTKVDLSKATDEQKTALKAMT